MFSITAPGGNEIQIPATLQEDKQYFTIAQVKEAAEYYRENGYVVLRGGVSPEVCKAVRQEFEQKVKNYDGFLYRQTGGNPEKHRLNDKGFVMNPILNVQDVPTRSLGDFRGAALKAICAEQVGTFLQEVFGEPAKVVQTMYFEGNSETWAHQDTYYLDSEKVGDMAAAWYAVEDIQPGAGRFFVYPGSHKIDLAKNGGDFDVAFNHARYKTLIIDVINKNGLICTAPCLREGDVLFWNAKTIHGSLKTTQPSFSRSSLTAHFIPESHRFLQFQSRIKPLKNKDIMGWQVNHPKSLDRLGSRLVLAVETSFPKAFQFAKWLAVKALVTR